MQFPDHQNQESSIFACQVSPELKFSSRTSTIKESTTSDLKFEYVANYNLGIGTKLRSLSSSAIIGLEGENKVDEEVIGYSKFVEEDLRCDPRVSGTDVATVKKILLGDYLTEVREIVATKTKPGKSEVEKLEDLRKRIDEDLKIENNEKKRYLIRGERFIQNLHKNFEKHQI